MSPSAWSTSTAFQAGLRSTAAAPNLLMALTATTNSGRLEVITATRSPAADTPGGKVSAKGGAEIVEGAERPAFVAGPNGVAVPEPCRGLLQGVVHRAAAIGNILLAHEIDVNMRGM